MRAFSIFSLLATGLLLPGLRPESALAQTCPGGSDICPAQPGSPPPCYRAPDDPTCDATCTCASPDYPACDAACAPGELCDPSCGNPCWDELAHDTCTDPPPACDPGSARPFTFVDDRDGKDDGQIYALGDRDPTKGCGTLLVDQTGYYEIFDMELSESCDDQLDETGYLRVKSSCNGEGWAVERNAGERFLIFDSDNTPPCSTDAECGPGKVCRPGNNHGTCCVPDTPVFMGTFLLVAGEPNEICLHHWCPEWKAELAAGKDYGFVTADCQGVNSIHFQVSLTAIACQDDTLLQACTFGCEAGSCLPDPCDAAACLAFCKDGVCLDQNPCDALACANGCKRGRCLQNQHARGPDADGDGYSVLADCDDANADAHPGAPELCENGADDNCDGRFDESPCEAAARPTENPPKKARQRGCGCTVTDPIAATSLAALSGLFGVLLLGLRRRSRAVGRPGCGSQVPGTEAEVAPNARSGSRFDARNRIRCSLTLKKRN